ncbi:MAG TPA: phosphoserine phosphatase SerB [Pseudorhodoplanes sp.]|nr:phosphoserine phosphatase SerB [Pseudorhodoplanes sp.]
MTCIATLIASGSLRDHHIAQAQAALPSPGAPEWLEPGTAADIPFTPDAALDQRAVSNRLRAALAGAPVDIAVQPLAHRRKKLLVADMDSTMIGQECIDELADYVGLKDHIAAITERAMRGEIAFEPALRERVEMLKGLPVSVVEEVITHRIALTPGARTLVRTMRARGAYTCLVSGGFTIFTAEIARMIGFDETRANTLLIGSDGRLLGVVQEPILGREAKLETLRELTAKLGLSPHETMAVGDGANDLAMIECAGLGVAYRAKPKLAAAAHARIDHCDLTALLYVQGYRRAEFAT